LEFEEFSGFVLSAVETVFKFPQRFETDRGFKCIALEIEIESPKIIPTEKFTSQQTSYT
jgi:hypothetical protein